MDELNVEPGTRLGPLDFQRNEHMVVINTAMLDELILKFGGYDAWSAAM